MEHNKSMFEVIEVVLRDSGALLRKNLGNGSIVDHLTTTNLVSPGDNYGSTLLKVDAVVRRYGVNSEAEKISLVAKMQPPTLMQREIFDSPRSFRKEIYMLEKIAPTYRAIEIECGVRESEAFAGLPELFGSRLSLREDADDQTFDDDAVILMENLKAKNYHCCERLVGLDLAHAKLALEELARFHALGIAAKFRKPVFFDEMKERAKSLIVAKENVEPIRRFLIETLKGSSDLHPYLDRIEEALNRLVMNVEVEHVPDEPWATICHNDLWTNNVMFRKDASGANPEDVKFVDFQTYVYANPLRDVVFFLFTSCAPEICAANFDDLLESWRGKFLSHLERLGCDVILFDGDSFVERVNAAAAIEYFHCLMMTRIISADPKTECGRNSPELLFQPASCPQSCRDRLADITSQFLRNNWI
ncbi:uncharacterized protein LOC105691072 [Athalia rosae]|uniref:uncharacterized protein LOC105691072 n=1 Tax=Athalia rosae TaxID=37344 RepID=UPI00203413D7|nr:uncharacterized protein LOC105691072 [Athalia rosae]